MSFQNVFSPLKIGSVTAPNRIFSSAHVPAMDRDGRWTDDHVRYYEAKARGGIGLIVTGAVQVSPLAGAGVGRGNEKIYAEGAAHWFKKGTDAVHAHGVPIFVQLWHGGRQAGMTHESMNPLLAPSAEPCPVIGEVPQIMDLEDIRQTVVDFANAAAIAREGGFDGVELHGSHGYLFTQFTSPFFNQRDDDYGGSLENRTRLSLEVIAAIREKVGRDFVLGYRLSGDELVDGGNGVAEVADIARRLTAGGMLDYISVSQGTYLQLPAIIPPMYAPLSLNVQKAARIKAAVDVPVFVAGRIKDPDQAEEILSKGHADMVAMTRAILCDSELPNKLREGRQEEIRNCIACNQKCWGNLAAGIPITCTLNPAAGRENDPFWAVLTPVRKRKRMIVVGAGPAGCEAARVLALRGHEVRLYERAPQIGGQLRVVQKASGRSEWEDVGRYYERELRRLGVDQRLNTDVTAEKVLEDGGDAVVVATGSLARTRPFGHLPNIAGEQAKDILDVRVALDGRAPLGRRVVVYCGEYHFQGITTAETLLERGHEVEIVTPLFALAPHGLAEGLTWETVMSRLYMRHVRNIRTWSAIGQFDRGRVTGFNVVNQEPFEIECDTLISAFGGEADDGLFRQLKGRVPELHRIGDCVAPRRVEHAIHDGGRIGRLL